jgi:peptidoglycan hydrolase CwlO-like protein
MPPARRVARRLLRTATVAALATVLLAAPASAGPADPAGARVGPWVAGSARADGALPGPGTPARPAAPPADRTARSVPKGDLGALRAEATRLRAKLDAQNRRLEVLAEELEEAYARGIELLADASRLDARRRAAVRELAAAQTALNQRARSAYIAGPGYYVSGFIGAGDPADTLARVPLQRAILDDDLALVDRVERAKAKLDDTRARLSARLVEQAQAAAGLDAKRVEAERLADRIGGELRTMDRRVRALIERQRRREEARQRASFASFMDAARAGAWRPRRKGVPPRRPSGPSGWRWPSWARPTAGAPRDRASSTAPG